MKNPAVLFYTSDFITGTMFMTNEQVGMYIRLLCMQHQKGHLSENEINYICKSHDIDVLSKFIKDENGLFYNQRMDEEILKRQAYSISRSENKLGKTLNKHKKIISKSCDNHMGNGNENINSNINKKSVKEKFEIFRKKYLGTKLGLEKEFIRFLNHLDHKTEIEKLLPALEKEILHKQNLKSKNLFCPEWKNLSTWINNRCWEQEFEIKIIENTEILTIEDLKKHYRTEIDKFKEVYTFKFMNNNDTYFFHRFDVQQAYAIVYDFFVSIINICEKNNQYLRKQQLFYTDLFKLAQIKFNKNYKELSKYITENDTIKYTTSFYDAIIKANDDAE
jgi:uncharacterized protein YdaU (DUF1376 family)